MKYLIPILVFIGCSPRSSHSYKVTYKGLNDIPNCPKKLNILKKNRVTFGLDNNAGQLIFDNRNAYFCKKMTK